MDAFRSRRRTIINTDPANYEALDLQCRDVVDRFQATAAPEFQLVPSIGDRVIDSQLFQMLVPTAASVAMALVVIAVTMNVRLANRIDELKQENPSLQASLNFNAPP